MSYPPEIARECEPALVVRVRADDRRGGERLLGSFAGEAATWKRLGVGWE